MKTLSPLYDYEIVETDTEIIATVIMVSTGARKDFRMTNSKSLVGINYHMASLSEENGDEFFKIKKKK